MVQEQHLEQSLDFEVEGIEATRLDVVLTAYLKAHGEQSERADLAGISRSKVSSWIVGGVVEVNDASVIKPSFKVESGDVISLIIPELQIAHLQPDSSVQFDIVYEDQDLAVINKPAGLIVHPGHGGEQGTLAHGLLARYGQVLEAIGHPMRPGIVHRLDKETSGLMVVALSQRAYQNLCEQFLPPRTVKRTYIALTSKVPYVRGQEQKFEGTIELPVGRHPTQRTKMVAREGLGKAAITHWRVAQAFSCGYELELRLETGRTHQIRVHLQAMRAPIVCDETYGFMLQDLPRFLQDAARKLNRVALHAHKLSLLHPVSGVLIEFTAEIPEDMQKMLDAFKSCESK